MIDIVRSKGDMRSSNLPLTWSPVHIGSSKRWTALVVCRNGHPVLLDDHKIGDDGTVVPGVVCDDDGCHWHAFLRLTGWPPK